MDKAQARDLQQYRLSIADTQPMNLQDYMQVLEALANPGSKAEAEARERLFRSHRYLVHQNARRFSHRHDGVAVADLIDAGTIALIEAASVFEPSSFDDGSRFRSLANRLVEDAMHETYGDDPSGDGPAGDREPRRPYPPTDSLGAELDHP